MTSEETTGAPATSTAKQGVGSAKQDYSSRSIKVGSSQSATFSGVILRALDNRPQNEDRLRGMV